MVGGSRQETLNPSFVPFSIRHAHTVEYKGLTSCVEENDLEPCSLNSIINIYNFILKLRNILSYSVSSVRITAPSPIRFQRLITV
ncbi:unnamed protein product [Schistosoma margrebowiei]|uniref:Uncharacterized protein n=1 Tax=Schistosoma margrebowiei TaxID=48269 RepID=A0A183LXR2_9TREM|nr:unnamed protein product [Schistosoma margrebowiei]